MLCRDGLGRIPSRWPSSFAPYASVVGAEVGVAQYLNFPGCKDFSKCSAPSLPQVSCCRAASVLPPWNSRCKIELIFGVMLQFNVVWCIRFRREIVLTIQSDNGKQGDKVGGKKYCRPKVVLSRQPWRPIWQRLDSETRGILSSQRASGMGSSMMFFYNVMERRISWYFCQQLVDLLVHTHHFSGVYPMHSSSLNGTSDHEGQSKKWLGAYSPTNLGNRLAHPMRHRTSLMTALWLRLVRTSIFTSNFWARSAPQGV